MNFSFLIILFQSDLLNIVHKVYRGLKADIEKRDKINGKAKSTQYKQ